MLTDGKRITTYTEQPDGLLLIDQTGHYSLQIFHPQRQSFRGSKVTASELIETVPGSSTNFGTINVDPTKRQLIFHINTASYLNWNNTMQVRDFSLQGMTLSYAVPAAASVHGTKAFSVWQRRSKLAATTTLIEGYLMVSRTKKQATHFLSRP